MQSAKQQEWFKKWFESSYYEILYQGRNTMEAEAFISRLVKHIGSRANGKKVLDLACGSGRHAAIFNDLGFKVVGLDLSERAIAEAVARNLKNCEFEVHDMRNVFCANRFDWGVNLFTSLGYFDDPRDNLRAINTLQKAVKPGGYIIIDYFNAEFICQSLIRSETKKIQDLSFQITKTIQNQFIVKDIFVSTLGETEHFQEKVQLIDLGDFKNWFSKLGIELVECFGNYSLDAFNSSDSERLIMVVQKPF